MDELNHAGDEHLDPVYVEGYDRKASFDPTPDFVLLRNFGFSAESTLIDFGTGAGEFALAAARTCRRVVAVDISLAMLEALRLKAARQGVTNLEVVRQGFLTYEHRGEEADFVFSRNALHHLPDFWKAVALERIARMLKAGGVLRLRDLVFSFEPEDSGRVIEAWLERAPARPEDGWTQIELETHLREEYSTFSWLLEPMLDRAGFEIRQAAYSESRVFAAYACVRV
jgi:ubiquinone/menaquinone biosynthesis C-methylase UbiE